ncbi:MAG: UDP-glucose 4-epimerase GalE [Brevundimonas sp.]|nr:UDP-glucose 4-epimerase GalE [Brevundimonas sp.]MDZ4060934.1 UDP-glucose 4-epimerase GalE [Brevundimonas sp.]
MTGTVLVTGGAGYIGSHAVLELLARGFKPVVLDDLSTGSPDAIPTGVEFRVGDVGDDGFLDGVLNSHRPVGVMHFAGSIVVEESVRDPLKYYYNNTSKTLSLLNAWIRHGGGPFIFSSTAAVYGVPPVQPVTERAEKAPMSPYGSSKWMSEVAIHDAALAHPEFRPISLRYFNVAGADPQGRTGQRGQQSTHLIRVAVETALGQRERLEVFGVDYDTRDGSCERDFIHVSDLAAAHVAALDYLLAGGSPAVFNCGYGRGYTVLEVVAALEQIVGRSLPVKRAGRRPGDIPRLVSDSTSLRRELNWTPRYDDLGLILRSALSWQSNLTR